MTRAPPTVCTVTRSAAALAARWSARRWARSLSVGVVATADSPMPGPAPLSPNGERGEERNGQIVSPEQPAVEVRCGFLQCGAAGGFRVGTGEKGEDRRAG